MKETPQQDGGIREPTGEYRNSLCAAYRHNFGDTVVPVNLFHNSEGVLPKQDGGGGAKAELSPEEASTACEKLKREFLDRMQKIDLDQTPPYNGPIDRNFFEKAIELASGDWRDPNVIQELMNQYNSVRHLWER